MTEIPKSERRISPKSIRLRRTKFKVERDGLPVGIYLYWVEGSDAVLVNGKIVTQ